MKKGISILLISLLLFNSAGYILVYFQLLYIFKSESKNIINTPEYQQFVNFELTIEEFEYGSANFYFVDDEEVIYNGNMYDIKEYKINGNNVTLTCYHDINESNLNQQFDRYFADNLSEKSSKTHNILNNIIYDAGLPISFDGTLSWREDTCFNFIFVPILNNFLEVPSPPPKFLYS